ncbi:sensor histidine kinase [Dactylosporangium fulvum]|uniref:sensor histidine kinase n=1 Tax=Dactylosporangium fulvum TaxID=53359 RepID=UPI0031D58E01
MTDLMRAVWAEPRPAGAPRRVWRDWALVAVLVPATVLEGIFRADVPWRGLSIAITLGLIPTVLWRRTRPLAVVAVAFGICGLATVLTSGAPPGLNAMAFMLILPYALYRWGSGAEAVIGSAVITAKMGAAFATGDLDAGQVLAGFALLSAACALGTTFRYRARARGRELEQARLLERERLARDLHDTVAHHVSAMKIRAQAGLATAAVDPRAAVDALHVIEAEASRALDEMRAMVRLLRRGEPEPVPNGVADLERLADRRRAGPSVDVQILGAVGCLPPSVGSTIYRLAQESVTNARRHARHATRIEVRVAADDTAVRLRVSDDGDPGAARPGAAPGYGLIGMRERAGLLGGTCEAGPDPGRGWTVTAVLPLTGAGRIAV